jgi:threonylcarbamoyladenosine tRNA methylthiotransferase MtaB
MYRFSIYTLGCKLNQLESESLADAFRREGFPVIPWGDPADILAINTCTVTSMADQKARRIIRKALRENPGACLIVTGCYAQLDAEFIESLEAPASVAAAGALRTLPAESAAPELALGETPSAGTCAFYRESNYHEAKRLFVLRGKDKSALLDLPRYLRGRPGALGPLLEAWFRHTGEAAAPLAGELPAETGAPAGGADVPWTRGGAAGAGASSAGEGLFRYAPEDFSLHSRGFLKIQDGCDSHCTFCRVSLARGPSVSLAGEKALGALQALEARGYGEAVLTGVNISQYRDGGRDLGDLLAYLLAGTNRIALRLSSLEPEAVTEKIAAAFAHRRIRPHFHLSIQSGSSEILRKMGRPYGPEDVKRGIALLRSVREDPFLACDIITGFPGEGEAEFNRTRALCEEAGFAWIHAFPYSRRPGTAAWSFGGPVAERDAVRRVDVLLDLARRGRRNYAARWIGREVEVILEGKNEKKTGQIPGISDNYLRTLIQIPPGRELPPAGTALICRLGRLPEGEAGSEGREFDLSAEPAVPAPN